MEGKHHKPVPDVESLRYKGTPDKPDIKIFVSHRIDLDSETINNPLYIPVRCGAVYDKRKGITMLGDDTGDNISEKREIFCELTVQYWAWKNVQADYYGLCHYRRYLSFLSERSNSVDIFNHIVENRLSDEVIKKYNLNEESMRSVIEKNDIICIEPMDLTKQVGVNVYDSLKNNPLTYDIKAVDLFIQILVRKFPNLQKYAEDYLAGYDWYGWNCYILKKEYFQKYNNILFSVLNEVEAELDMTSYNQEQLRQVGYFGEILFPIYLAMLRDTKDISIAKLQVLKIEKPEKTTYYSPAFSENNIALAFASSNEYAPILGEVLQSVCDNASDEYNYDITILSNNISKTYKEILSKIPKTDNFSIRFFEISSYLDGRHFYTRDHVTVMTYVRLAVLDIFRHYDKVLYLDSDITVNRDLADLYLTELGENYLAAVRDTVMLGWCNGLNKEQHEYNRSVLKLKDDHSYFNGGVLLFNLKKLRESYTSDQLLDMAASQKWKWFDQDVLNVICQGKVVFLPENWNLMVHVWSVPQQLPEYFAPYQYYKNYQAARNDPWIIHYAGHVVPCFNTYVDRAELFWRYAKKTEFYEILLLTMCRAQYNLGTEVSNTRSRAREFADKWLPLNSRRRALAKKIVPRDSLLWRFMKQIQYLLHPEYRPAKSK